MSPFVRALAFAAISLSAAHAALAAAEYPKTENFGVPFSEDEQWYRQCMRVATLSAPAMPASHAASQTCNASSLYYDKRSQAATSQAEWNKVRACAIASGDHTVLMMLYANGFGVRRDRDMAIHYACSLEFIAKREMEVRVEHLAAASRTNVPFDQCDDITSGYMGTICAGIQEHQNQRVRLARLNRLRSTLAQESRAAFDKLRVAAERYASEPSETDMQGTAAPSLWLEHQGRLREQFMQAAMDVSSGNLPAASSSEYAQRDGELNALYTVVMTAPSTQDGWPDRIGDSTITHANVRKAERLWLAYRDAFVAYVATLPSGPDPVAVKMLLTKQRMAQLADVARYGKSV